MTEKIKLNVAEQLNVCCVEMMGWWNRFNYVFCATKPKWLWSCIWEVMGNITKMSICLFYWPPYPMMNHFYTDQSGLFLDDPAQRPPPHLECTKAHWMVWRCWKKSVNYILWPSHLAKRFQSNVLDYLNIYGVHSSSISCSGSWWPNSAYTVEKFIMTDYIEEEFTTVRRRVQNVGLFWGRVPSARLYWWRVHNFTLYWWGIHNLSYVDRVHTVRLHWGRVYSAGLCRGTVWLYLGRFSNSRIY